MKKYLSKKRRNSFIPFVLFFLLLPFFSLFAQQKKLDVDGDLRIHSPDSGPESGKFRNGMALVPHNAIPIGSCTSGTLSYCAQDKRLYGCLNSSWQPLGSGATTDRYEVTRIVAAYDSFGSKNGSADCNGTGGACINQRADYTCDGTDDHFVINRAINELPTSGGTVYLLEGTYNITSYFALAPLEEGPGIRLDRNNVTLMGAGRATVLQIHNPTGSFYTTGVEVINTPSAHTSSIENLQITQLTVDGKSRNGSNNKGIALYGSATGVKNVKIDKVWVRDIDGDGIYLLSNVENISISGSFIQNNAGYGINEICGLSTESNNRTNIIGNTIRSNDLLGVRISGQNNNQVLIQGNNIQNNLRSGIGLSQASYSTIRVNNITNNGISGVCTDINGGCDGIFIENMNMPGYRQTGYTPDNTLICENNILGNWGRGIKLANSVFKIMISRNNIVDNHEQGVYLNNSQDNFISGNRIHHNGISSSATGKRGIDIGFACDYTHISGNYISGPVGSGSYGIYIGDNGALAPKNFIFANKIKDFNVVAPSTFNYPIYNFNTENSDWQDHGVLYTDSRNINLQTRTQGYTGGWGFDVFNSSISYFKIMGDGGEGSAGDGVSPGDMVIIEIADTDGDSFMISRGEDIALPYSNEYLYFNDTLVLLWNGQEWLKIGGSY